MPLGWRRGSKILLQSFMKYESNGLSIYKIKISKQRISLYFQCAEMETLHISIEYLPQHTAEVISAIAKLSISPAFMT